MLAGVLTPRKYNSRNCKTPEKEVQKPLEKVASELVRVLQKSPGLAGILQKPSKLVGVLKKPSELTKIFLKPLELIEIL